MIITQADKGGTTIFWSIDEYLKETYKQLNNEEFSYELPTNHFEDY